MAKAEREGFVSQAKLSNFHVSPRKARLVVDMIRGQDVGRALEILSLCEKKTGAVVRKLLMSAVANAKHQQSVDVDELVVKRVWVNEGKVLHRSMPRARGSASPIHKRHSTITILLDEAGAK